LAAKFYLAKQFLSFAYGAYDTNNEDHATSGSEY
jgi:hypothetical protein